MDSVTQIDREAHLRIFGGDPDTILSGEADSLTTIQELAAFRLAATATALAEREGERAEIARLTEERDGARKALDYLMSDPAVPLVALERTRQLMQHYRAGQQ